MIKSLRPGWLRRIFGENDGSWKSYLRVSLKRYGGLFLFYCNYDIKEFRVRKVQNIPHANFFMFILLISNHTVFLVQFGINLHLWVFQKSKLPSFCKSEPETPHHLLFPCNLVQPFWNDFEYFFYLLPRDIRPSYSARCHDLHYICKLSFTKLFDTSRQIVYIGLQKKSDSSYYKRF